MGIFKGKKIVFCFQNCSGHSDNLFLRSLEKLIQIVRGLNNFWNRISFKIIPEGFSDIRIIVIQKFKKKIGF